MLVENAQRRPLRWDDSGLLARLDQWQSLSEQDRQSVLHILDALLTKNKVKSLAEDLS